MATIGSFDSVSQDWDHSVEHTGGKALWRCMKS